jgi:hypothetical protein
MVLIMTPTSGLAQTRPPVALEHQEMVAKRAKEREKIENCQKQATEEKILPRDRPQFVVKCLDGATGPSQPSVAAPEYQERAGLKSSGMTHRRNQGSSLRTDAGSRGGATLI